MEQRSKLIMKNKFTLKEKRVLTEIYRRINYFHGGALGARLLYLALPSEAKPAKELGIIEASSVEVAETLTWYRLTELWKQFFSHYVSRGKISEELNLAYFDGSKVMDFDKSLLMQTK